MLKIRRMLTRSLLLVFIPTLLFLFSVIFSVIVVAIDYQLGVANGLEPPEEDGLTTTATSATYTLKNHENDVTNHLKEETNRLKQQIFVVRDTSYEEEDYIFISLLINKLC